MRRRLPRFAVFAVLMALSAATWAAPVDDLKAATQELTARNESLKVAIERYESKLKEKAAAEARLALLRKEHDATTDARKRSSLAQQMKEANAGVDLLLASMLEYQRMVAKEAREDRRLADRAREIATRLKASNLRRDNKAIDEGMKEAHEKADLAMSQATSMLALSVVSGALAVASGAASSADAGK